MQSTDKAQQQGFPERQYAAASEHGDSEYEDGARNDQSDNCQAFHAGEDQYCQAQPLWVAGEPLGKGIEPLAHAGFLESRSPFDLTKGGGFPRREDTARYWPVRSAVYVCIRAPFARCRCARAVGVAIISRFPFSQAS